MKNTLKIRIFFVSLIAFILAITAFSGYYFNSEKVTAAVYDNQINYDSTGYLVGNLENYSPIITYNAGDICLYNDGIYQCVQDESIGISPSNTENWHRTSVLSAIMNSEDNNSFHYSDVTKPGVSKTSNIKVTTTRDYLSDYKLAFTGGLSTSTSTFHYDPVEELYYSNAFLKMDENDSSIDISLEYNGAVQNYTPLEFTLAPEAEVQEINLDELVDKTENFESILIAHSDLAKTLSTNSVYTNNPTYFEPILKYMIKYGSDYFGETLNSIKRLTVSESINTLSDLFNNPAAITAIVNSSYGKYFLDLNQKFSIDNTGDKFTVAQIVAADKELLKALGKVENINYLISDCLNFRNALNDSPYIETVSSDIYTGIQLKSSVEKGLILLGYSSGYAYGSQPTNTIYPTTVTNACTCTAIACPEINIEENSTTNTIQKYSIVGQKIVYNYRDPNANGFLLGSKIYNDPSNWMCENLCLFSDSINVVPMSNNINYTMSCPDTPAIFNPTNINISTPSKTTTITYIDLCK